MNVLLEAQKIIEADALSLREGYMVYGEFKAPPEAVAEIEHLENVARQLGASANGNECAFRAALETIRDSTFRNAMQLRSIAHRVLEAAEPRYMATEAGLAALDEMFAENRRLGLYEEGDAE